PAAWANRETAIHGPHISFSTPRPQHWNGGVSITTSRPFRPAYARPASRVSLPTAFRAACSGRPRARSPQPAQSRSLCGLLLRRFTSAPRAITDDLREDHGVRYHHQLVLGRAQHGGSESDFVHSPN